MREIKLATSNAVAIVDDEFYDYLSGFRWFLSKSEHQPNGYAYRSTWVRGSGSGKKVSMSRDVMRLIVGRPLTDAEIVDHRNGNSLHNTRGNLRVGSRSANQFNRGVGKANSSGFKGVSRKRARWSCELSARGKRFRHVLGSPQDAAQVYVLLAFLHHGEFARTN